MEQLDWYLHTCQVKVRYRLTRVWTTSAKTPEGVFLPTASMPLSRSPDISLQMLFSTSLPHMCWYSWNTTHTHAWQHSNTSEPWCWTLPLSLLQVPALRWGLLLAHRMALNLDSSVPSLFSPAAYRACNKPDNSSVAKSGPCPQQLGQSFTWASCFAKETSTFSCSSRLPWKHQAETHQQLYKHISSQYKYTESPGNRGSGSGPERERWEAFWSGPRCPLWWRPPVTSYILKSHKNIQFWFMLTGNKNCFVISFF